MAGAVVLWSAPWFRSLVFLALVTANATPLVRAEDTVAADRTLSGDGKLVSRGGKFALGFFQPDGGATDCWYVGIWYHNISVRTPVWVANRDRPVSDPVTSRLAMAADGNLVLLDASGELAWSTNASTRVASDINANKTVAVLLNTGNLVLVPSSNVSDVLWQSFDHIGNTWLPGAKLGRDKLTGVIHGMTSWRWPQDPATGACTLQLDPAGALQFVLLCKGAREQELWASGNWDGRNFLDTPEFSAVLHGHRFRLVDNDRESYFTYDFSDDIFHFVIYASGQVQGLFWDEAIQEWLPMISKPIMSRCFVPLGCGAFGVCITGMGTPCSCPLGFSPRDPATWSRDNFTGGCVRNVELQCGKNSSNNNNSESNDDRFFLMLSMTLPDDGRVVAVASSSGDCERACLGDCTCSAYAYNGSCILWYNEIQNLQENYGDWDSAGSLYLRLAASELPGPGATTRHERRRTVEIALGALGIVFFVVGVSILAVRTTLARGAAKVQVFQEGGVVSFKYRDLRAFTKNFSDKLGGGAFGSVYKGQLPDRTNIAVKKLEGFRQGEKQFRAEVSTLGTIQHVNLIRLLGFCSNGKDDRKLLVYPYIPNGSLDRHLFGSPRFALSWRTRYQIAIGVAKGLSYLHDKCLDCIIHCDVKPENILLDAEFAPKVADFGLAKVVGRDFSRVLTTMRGTMGYLAPEWFCGVAITAKADVFSYGMMLLEIVSGRRNIEHGMTASSGPELSDHAAEETRFFPLLAARWLAETEGDVKVLLDPAVANDDVNGEEVRRACKVACWCVQDDVDARPTMAEVVQMLQGMKDVEVPPVPRYLQVLAG